MEAVKGKYGATILLNYISAHCQALIPRKVISYNEFMDGAQDYFCLSENLTHWCFKKMVQIPLTYICIMYTANDC